STLVYVGAADGEEAGDETYASEEAVSGSAVEAAVSSSSSSSSSSEEIEEPVEITEADEVEIVGATYDSSYAQGDTVDLGISTLTVTAAQPLTGGSTLTTNNINTPFKDDAGTAYSGFRLALKVIPSVNGNITVNLSSALGTDKTMYIIKYLSGDEAVTTNVGSMVGSIVSSAQAGDTSIMGFLSANTTYYIAFGGTKAKISTVSFAEGDTAVTTTTEATTEATTEIVELVDIRTLNKPTPGTASDGSKHTLWLVGDSTGCYYNETDRMINRNGFGMALGDDASHSYTAEYKIFDNENFEVRNLAVSGRSSLDYLTDAYYTTLTSNWKEGDYLIIAFGHNDQKTEASRFTNASLGADGWNVTGQFAYSLYSSYILPAVQAGVTPILATPIVRRSTSSSGPSGSNVHDLTSSNESTNYGNYRQTIIDLGSEFGLSVIDNTYNTYMECITLGAGDITLNEAGTAVESATGYAAYHSVQASGSIDNTHVGPAGARMIAYFMGQTIKGNELQFGVTGDGTSTGITSILTDGSADNGEVFDSLATFFGEDASIDPRTGEYSDGSSEDSDAFQIKLTYDGTASSLQAGDEFTVNVAAANVEEAGIGSVTVSLTYDTQEVSLVTGSDITDAAGNVIISASDYASAVAAQTSDGTKNTITLTVSYDTAVTADGTLFSIPMVLNKRGEITISITSVAVTDSTGTAYEDVETPSFVINADSDINESDGLVITPTVSANEDGSYTVDYVLDGNTTELGLSAMTLYVCYDPAVISVTGANDTAEVGSVDAAGALLLELMPYETVAGQIALVPTAGDTDYDNAAAGPADGTKTAAELGKIRLANYLADGDEDGTNDTAYNNGIIFSLKVSALTAASADEVLAAITTATPAAGAFGAADGSEVEVTIEGNTATESKGIRGDVDNNGILTANDAACLLAYAINNEAKADSWVVTDYVANVNGDEEINAADAAEVLAKVLNAAYVFTADLAA
ncbi:MAG: hypothetical protein LUD81_04285, partial [Clostridiales bacterium]|nr:hypothetical protein [Clostridiales bacterium]